jgi:hypothetical protein
MEALPFWFGLDENYDNIATKHKPKKEPSPAELRQMGWEVR